MIKIGICDDDEKQIKNLLSLTNNWCDENNILSEIKTFNSAENFLFNYNDDKNYDILLLDIEMGKIDGVSLAKIIRKENKFVQIIFITGYSEYISEGYEVEALHYLMKPLNETKFFEVLNRAKEKLAINEKKLKVDVLGETTLIPCLEIKYLEVIKNYVTIHGKCDYIVKKTLSEFMEELDNRFFKCGRSFIVNLEYIEKISKTTIYLINGDTIPLPRGMYGEINKAIIERL